jgi:hypothetical protein
MVTEHKHRRIDDIKWRATIFGASALVAALSLNVHAATADKPQPSNSPNNTGFVLVTGFGYQGTNMLFCEPKVGHINESNIRQVSALEVKDGKCLMSGLGTREFRALTAQQYLDELIGPDLVEPVGIAPMPGYYGWVISVIYYRPTERSTQ